MPSEEEAESYDSALGKKRGEPGTPKVGPVLFGRDGVVGKAQKTWSRRKRALRLPRTTCKKTGQENSSMTGGRGTP